MNKNLIIFLLISIVTVGCNKRLLPTSSIEKEYGLESFDFEYLQAKTKIKFDGVDKSLTSSATIRMKKDSIIWISLTPIFGLEAARGMITADTVVFLDRVNKEVYRYNFESLSRQLNFDVDFQLLQSVILGNQLFKLEKTDEFSKKNEAIRILQNRGRFQLMTDANEKTRKVQHVNIVELPAGNLMSLKFSEFNTIKNQAFPYEVNVQILNKSATEIETTTVNITHSKVEVSSEAISFPFSVSSKYED